MVQVGDALRNYLDREREEFVAVLAELGCLRPPADRATDLLRSIREQTAEQPRNHILGPEHRDC